MPVIQDSYSVNVTNRFNLGLVDDQESDNEEIDPLEQLRLLEEQKQRVREQKKKLKTQQQTNKKTQSDKKAVQFKENKDANVPKKKDPVGGKEKSNKQRREGSGPDKKPSGDRRLSGDENQRPNRRRNDQNRGPRGGDGDQFIKSYDDQGSRFGRGMPSSEGEEKTEKRTGGRFERYRGSRGGGRGQGGGSYGYRNRNDGRDDRGKREFDRRSGSDRSGVRPTDKRDGGGSRNWGTPGKEFEETTNEANVSTEEVGTWNEQAENEPPVTEVKIKQEEEGDANEASEKEESEVAEMTLDEWKAMQRSRKQAFNIRKPGEGEDSKKWGNMKMIHASTVKTQEPEVIIDDSHKDSHKKAPVKATVDVDIRFTDMPTRGGRGGRGNRGRGGRGGYRSGPRGGGNRQGNRYSQPLPPDLNDKDFPTLAAA